MVIIIPSRYPPSTSSPQNQHQHQHQHQHNLTELHISEHLRKNTRIYVGDKSSASQFCPSDLKLYDLIVSIGFSEPPPPPPRVDCSVRKRTKFLLFPTVLDIPTIKSNGVNGYYQSGDLLTPLLSMPCAFYNETDKNDDEKESVNTRKCPLQYILDFILNNNDKNDSEEAVRTILIHCTYGQSRSTTLSLMLLFILDNITPPPSPPRIPSPPKSLSLTLAEELQNFARDHSEFGGPGTAINPFLMFQLSLIHKFLKASKVNDLDVNVDCYVERIKKNSGIRGVTYRSLMFESLLPSLPETNDIADDKESSKFRCLNCSLFIFDSNDVITEINDEEIVCEYWASPHQLAESKDVKKLVEMSSIKKDEGLKGWQNNKNKVKKIKGKLKHTKTPSSAATAGLIGVYSVAPNAALKSIIESNASVMREGNINCPKCNSKLGGVDYSSCDVGASSGDGSGRRYGMKGKGISILRNKVK